MNTVIEKIRNRPPHHRDRIVWICAIIAVIILLVAWMLVGNGRKTTNDDNFFQDFNQGVQEGKNVVPAPSDVTPQTQSNY